VIKLTKYTGVPAEGLDLVVRDDGKVRVQLAQDGRDAEAWLASRKDGKSDTRGKLRPEVAFRKAVESIKWYCKSIDLSQEKGRITFSRTNDGLWFVRFTMYPGVPMFELILGVKDDRTILNSSVF
jgi:hypothetical protein